MSTPRLAPVPNTGYVPKPYDRIVLRPFDPARRRLRDADGPAASRLRPARRDGTELSVRRPAASATRQRALAGTCFVATCHGHVIATMTLHERDQAGTNHLYRCRDVASLRQFGVDPIWQSRGVGRALVAFAVRWAASRGLCPARARHALSRHAPAGLLPQPRLRNRRRGPLRRPRLRPARSCAARPPSRSACPRRDRASSRCRPAAAAAEVGFSPSIGITE